MNGLMNTFVAIALAAISFTSTAALAASFRFEQIGLDEGAQLIGAFTGADENGDGRLTIETLPGGLTGSGPPFVVDSELDSFTVTFTGNTVVSAFSLDLSAIFATQFGIPCCGPGEPYAFYFDLADPGHLEFVAMSPSRLVMFVKDSAFGNFVLAGEGCNFVNGGGGCAARSGAPYDAQVSAVPVPPSLWLLLPALGTLCVSGRQDRAENFCA